MTDHPNYHEGMRSLQDIRETRPLADRLAPPLLVGINRLSSPCD